MRSGGIPIEATRLVGGFRAFQMVVAACRLKLPDLLDAGPKNSHDWDDEHASVILKKCRAAMHQASRLMLLERVMPERVDDPDRDLANVTSDLHIMILLGGQERTPAEYGRLFSGAGLTMIRQVAMESVFGAFEAVSN